MKFWIDLPMPSGIGKPVRVINPVAAIVMGVVSGLVGGLLAAACSALLK